MPLRALLGEQRRHRAQRVLKAAQLQERVRRLEFFDGREMRVYSDLLTAAIRSIVQVKEEKDLDSLFSGQKPTALTGPATGIDDFELIAFLVVEPVVESIGEHAIAPTA